MRNYFNLQLFAKSNSTTKSSSTTNSSSTTQSSEQSGSNTHTEGGSTSSTSGWSNTSTYGTSNTVGHSDGGAHSESNGKSWASGQVEDKTQAMRDQYNTDYQQGQKAQDAYQRLQDTLDQKPTFESQYENKLNELYDSIMNREKFTYDFNADAMYNMYKDKYTSAGKSAMQDTMAQNAALTGGYGSSYSQTAGQQTYQNYLQQLNDMLPTLRNQAYSEYQDEGNRLLQNYNLASDAYGREYNQYRDSVSDWQSDRAFNQSNYQDERNFDYNQFANERNYWNQEYWNEKNAEQSTYNAADEQNWNDSTSTTKSESHSNTNYGKTTNTSSWSDSVTNAWANAISKTNSTKNTSSTSSTSSTTPDSSVSSSSSAFGSLGSSQLYPSSSTKAAQYDSRGFKLNDNYSTTDKYGNSDYNSNTAKNWSSSDSMGSYYDGLPGSSELRRLGASNPDRLQDIVQTYAQNPDYAEQVLDLTPAEKLWLRKVTYQEQKYDANGYLIK